MIKMREMNLKVKGILLDLDGTIVDSTEAYLEAARTAFAVINQKMVDSEIVSEIPRRLEQCLPVDDIVKEDPKKFLEIYLKTFYKITAVKTKVIPQISDTLKTLSKKAKLALITMRYVPKGVIMKELEKFNLASYFHHVITALDTLNPKPSPEAIIKSAGMLNIQLCDCIVVGDSVVDIKAGKAAGAKTVAVLSGIFSIEELNKEQPDLILENITQLAQVIET